LATQNPYSRLPRFPAVNCLPKDFFDRGAQHFANLLYLEPRLWELLLLLVFFRKAPLALA
jgi:hypothetical protein